MNYTMYTTFHTMVEEKGIEATAEYALAHGFSSVELFSMSGGSAAVPDVKAAKEVRRVLDAYGLPMACSSVFFDAENEAFDGIRRRLEISAILGTPYLHHTLLPTSPKTDTKEEHDRRISTAVSAALKIAEEAKGYGICCIYEDQGRTVNGVAGFGEFFGAVKREADNVGVCADLGNIFYVNEKPEDFLRVFAPDVKHLHIKDYLQRPAEDPIPRGWHATQNGMLVKDTLVGNGVINIAECLSILKKAGYRGAYALELCHEEPIELGITCAMETVSRILSEV